MTKKLLEKSPINYPLVRCLGWLVPRRICSDQGEALVSKLGRCLNILVDCGFVLPRECDDIISQYRSFARHSATRDEFLQFAEGKSWLDSLMYDSLAAVPEWQDLWKVNFSIFIVTLDAA